MTRGCQMHRISLKQKLVIAGLIVIYAAVSFMASCKKYDFAVSPKNDKIVFNLDEGKHMYKATNNAELYSYDMVKRRLEKLTNNSVFDGAPDFSPDGEEIVYMSGDVGSSPKDDIGESLEIRVMNLKNKESKVIANGINPDWSPKTAKIGYLKPDGNSDETSLFVVDRGTGEQNFLCLVREDTYSFCWGSQGKNIFYFTIECVEDPNGGYFDWQNIVRSIDVETRETKDIICLDKEFEAVGNLSSGGDYLAFTIERKKEDPNGNLQTIGELYVINLEDKGLQVISDMSGYFAARFSPSGVLAVSDGIKAIRFYETKDGEWVKKNEIYNPQAQTLWGAMEWIVEGDKEKLICALGKETYRGKRPAKSRDGWEFLLDSNEDFTGEFLKVGPEKGVEENLTEKILGALEAVEYSIGDLSNVLKSRWTNLDEDTRKEFEKRWYEECNDTREQLLNIYKDPDAFLKSMSEQEQKHINEISETVDLSELKQYETLFPWIDIENLTLGDKVLIYKVASAVIFLM